MRFTIGIDPAPDDLNAPGQRDNGARDQQNDSAGMQHHFYGL
jgi:hypothetical protein